MAAGHAKSVTSIKYPGDPEFKEHRYLYNPAFYYAHGLSQELREKIETDTRKQKP